MKNKNTCKHGNNKAIYTCILLLLYNYFCYHDNYERNKSEM